MKKYTPAARIWVELVALAALALTGVTHYLFGLDGGDPLAFVLLGVCAALADTYPIRPAFNNVTYRLTITFVVAGALLLSPLHAALIPALALAPALWLRRRTPGIATIWAFNTAQTVLASLATWAWVHWTASSGLTDVRDLLALVGAIGIFTLTQALLVGVIIGLNSGRSPIKSGTFAPSALLGDVLIAGMGILIAELWLARPLLLLTIPPLLFVVHRLTRAAHLAELAETDPKTGLPNSRHFERVLDEELAHSRRVNRPLSLAFVDLDHFKRVNDQFGHEAGDQVLREVADQIRGKLRKSDVVARFGGEEFVILLPGTDTEEAVYLAEQLRAAVAGHAFVLDGGNELECTISVGIATSPEDGTDVSTLLRSADAAMYRAKQTRNTVAQVERSGHEQQRSAAARPRSPKAAPRAVAARSRFLMSAVLWGTVLGGLLLALCSVNQVIQSGGWDRVLPFVALAILAELLQVRISERRGQHLTFSLAVAVTLASVTAHTMAAPLVALSAVVVHSVRSRSAQRSRLLFNAGNLALAAGCASWTYRLIEPSAIDFTPWHLATACLAVFVYFAVNLGAISLMVSLTSGRSISAILSESGWSLPINAFLGLTGAFIGGAHEQLGLLGTALFVVPVLLMRFTLLLYSQRSQLIIQTLETQADQLEQQTQILEHQASHDALTELPNRVLLQERLEAALETNPREPVALLILDLDRFKEINDTFGHDHGDRVLAEFGRRLDAALRDTSTGTTQQPYTVARLGGDEFAILLQAADVDQACIVSDMLLHARQEPFIIEGCPVDVGASIGIAVGPQHGQDPVTLLRRAEVAMYVAKQQGGGYSVYSLERDRYSPERLVLIGDLRQAIESNALMLYFQPKVTATGGRVHSMEALLRWEHPRFGLIPPDLFIPLAEHTGLIKPLTRWVLNAALAQCRDWLDSGREVPVAVNASMHDLHDVHLPELIANLLELHGVPARCLLVEITEGAIMSDAERAMGVLTRLRDLGVGVAVDDFGTGYSSMAYLGQLPVDELKIDRSFVRELSANVKHAAIVRSTIALGHDLGLTVVAEGIEDGQALDLLRRFGCDLVQGYFVSRPLPASKLGPWLNNVQWTPKGRLAA